MFSTLNKKGCRQTHSCSASMVVIRVRDEHPKFEGRISLDKKGFALCLHSSSRRAATSAIIRGPGPPCLLACVLLPPISCLPPLRNKKIIRSRVDRNRTPRIRKLWYYLFCRIVNSRHTQRRYNRKRLWTSCISALILSNFHLIILIYISINNAQIIYNHLCILNVHESLFAITYYSCLLYKNTIWRSDFVKDSRENISCSGRFLWTPRIYQPTIAMEKRTLDKKWTKI